MTVRFARRQDSRLSFPHLVASASQHSTKLAIWTDILDRLPG